MSNHRHIKIEFDDGSPSIELPHISHEIEAEFGKEEIGIFKTYRSTLQDVEIEEGFDKAYVIDEGIKEFGGPIKEDVNQGTKTELIVESTERFGRDAEPVPPGEIWNNVPDSDIIKDAIENVNEWSEGNIETVEPAVSHVFSHSSQAKKARKIEGSTSGELKFHSDGSVDYLDAIGSDNTDVTLSPANQNVVGDIEVSREGAEGRVTHLRLVGAGEGPHQITATVVSDDWEEGDSTKWDTYRDKSITDADTLERMGESIIAELNEVTIEVDLAVKGPEVDLGDWYHVTKPKDGLDRDLRVVELTTIVDDDGRKHSCVLANKWDSREDPSSKRHEDVENYNVAVEGTAVPINATGGRQPVTSDIDYQMRLYYPSEVKYEHRLNVRVIGLPYRAYSSGAASTGAPHSHDFEIDEDTDVSTIPSTLDSTGGNISAQTLTDSWSTLFTVSADDTSMWASIYSAMYVPALGPDEDWSIQVRIVNTDTGETYPSGNFGSGYTSLRVAQTPMAAFSQTIPEDTSEGTWRIQARLASGQDNPDDESLFYSYLYSTSSTHTHTFATSETSSEESGEHTHDPDPGVIEFNHYPSDCDVTVNGESVETSFGGGSSEFQEAVDVRGELEPGKINTIEVSSETLGHLVVYVEGDVYRQILGSG